MVKESILIKTANRTFSNSSILVIFFNFLQVVNCQELECYDVCWMYDNKANSS